MSEHSQTDLVSLHAEFVAASRSQAEAAEEWDSVFLPIEPLSANGDGLAFTKEQLDAQRRVIAADKRFAAASDAYWSALRVGR